MLSSLNLLWSFALWWWEPLCAAWPRTADLQSCSAGMVGCTRNRHWSARGPQAPVESLPAASTYQQSTWCCPRGDPHGTQNLHFPGKKVIYLVMCGQILQIFMVTIHLKQNPFNNYQETKAIYLYNMEKSPLLLIGKSSLCSGGSRFLHWYLNGPLP